MARHSLRCCALVEVKLAIVIVRVQTALSALLIIEESRVQASRQHGHAPTNILELHARLKAVC
jgi:hypothetical protein